MRISNAKRIESYLLSICCVVILFSIVAISMIIPGYAQTLRTQEVKLQFKKVVEAGHTEIILVFARDQATGLPISGALARLTVTYPLGTPVRVFNVLTDANGVASLSLPINRDAELGSYALDTLVTGATGYQDTPIGTVDFAVMSHVTENISVNDYSGHLHSSSIHQEHHHHHH